MQLTLRRASAGIVVAILAHLPSHAHAQWAIQDIATAGNSGWDIATAQDYAGGIHVGYFTTTGNYNFADKVGNTWTARTPVSAGGADVALTRRNQLGLAVTQYTGTYQVGFGERNITSSSWSVSPITSGTLANEPMSLEYDPL